MAFDAHPQLNAPSIVWAALNSFFQGQGDETTQTAAVMSRLRQTPPRNTLLVTHQVNISALTGQSTAMGEVLLCRWPTQEPRLQVMASLRP